MEPQSEYVSTLIGGLENMLSTGNHADVTIVVAGKVFPCHKVSIKMCSHRGSFRNKIFCKNDLTRKVLASLLMKKSSIAIN